MGTRIELDSLLKNILGSDYVYFQPPSTVKMSYPAIVYSRAGINNTHADNKVYKQDLSYELTVIDKDPDSVIVTKISQLPKCRWNRHYKADNLNHDVFILYY